MLHVNKSSAQYLKDKIFLFDASRFHIVNLISCLSFVTVRGFLCFSPELQFFVIFILNALRGDRHSGQLYANKNAISIPRLSI